MKNHYFIRSLLCSSSYRFVQHEFAKKLLVDEGDEEEVSTTLSHHPQYTNVIGVLQRDRVLQHSKVMLRLKLREY